MSEEEQASRMSRIAGHRLVILVTGAIIVALFLVVISMALYTWRGTAQLDLSRPGYKSVQSQAQPFDKFESFSASGPIDKKTLDDFKKLYDSQAKDSAGIDAFGGDVLDDQTLHIEDPATTAAQ